MKITPNDINYDLIAGIFFTLFGTGLIIFRKWVSIKAVKWNTILWHFSATEKQYKAVFVLAGIIFSIFGLLHLLGILHTRVGH